jgi:hypothetical protein
MIATAVRPARVVNRFLSTLLLSLSFVLAGSQNAMSATINVTANAPDVLYGRNGVCSLREAITNINDALTLYADCVPTGAYGTNDTINIPAGTYTTTIGGYGINKSVSIVGSVASSTIINGNVVGSVFTIVGAYTVSISGVTITGGATAGYGIGNGGGIYQTSGTLTVTNSTISGNTTGGNGGGIYQAGNTLTVTNSTISNNTGATGGGIYQAGGTLTITNSTISGNTARSGGGGISGSNLTVTNSTISGNTASACGALFPPLSKGRWRVIAPEGLNPRSHTLTAPLSGDWCFRSVIFHL